MMTQKVISDDKYWFGKNFAIGNCFKGFEANCASCNTITIGRLTTFRRKIPIFCKECFLRIGKAENDN